MRAVSFEPGSNDGPAPIDTAVLDAQSRHLRRKLITCRNGTEVLIDFEKPVRLADGDQLILQDGHRIAIAAAREELLEIRGRDAAHLARLAWHIGNRHLEAQIEPARILIRRDHVIAKLLAQQDASVKNVEEPFEPEHGAYHGHGH